MSLKMKLTSTIIAFFLVLGLVIMGVMAAPSATVNLGGTITFKATNVYAKVTGKISGTNAETQPTLDDITIDDKTIDGDITTWSSQDLAFKDDGSAITIEVTIENLATDRKLYAYITDTKQNVANVNKTMKQGEAEYKDTELITLDSTTTKTTITLSMEIDDKNQSLATGALYGYNIVLMDISGIPELSEDMTYETLKFRTIDGQSGLSVEDIGAEQSYEEEDDYYESTGDLVIPAYVNNGGTIYPVTVIADYAFGCEDWGGGASIIKVSLPNTITSIEDSAFSYCSSLASITIPDGVTSIGLYAFSYCSSLASITIPDGVTSIGFGAFEYCDSLTSITIPDSVTSIEEWAFEGCSSLTSVTIGNGVTRIGGEAFASCDSLTSITIPDSVTRIGEDAFSDCTSLESVTIGNGVTSIENSAFDDCGRLTSVTIGNGVTRIGGWAFSDCESLTDVYYRGTESQWSAITISSNNAPLTSATIHYEYTGE